MGDNNFNAHPSGPLISAILPVYNGEAYLAEAVESILAQTYKNFELIIIDDGSTDGSLSLLKEYESLDSRIILVSRPNKDLVATLNESIELASGQWIARMDQDDISLPYRFHKQLERLERSSADICGCWVKSFGGLNRRTYKFYKTDQAIKIDMLFKNPFAHPSVMMRANLFRKLRYDNRCEKAEDYDLWERAAQSGLIMTNVPEVLLKYRKHDSQVSTKSTEIQQKVANEIRTRYWLHKIDSLDLPSDSLAHIMSLINSNPVPDLGITNAVFDRLLTLTHGEARQALIDNIARLYMRIAPRSPDVMVKWLDLVNKHDIRDDFKVRVFLWVFMALKINYNNKFVTFTKKISK